MKKAGIKGLGGGGIGGLKKAVIKPKVAMAKTEVAVVPEK